MNKIEFGTHICFVLGVPNPKTKTWLVETKDSGQIIGGIAWFGPWRCYSFLPNSNTVYEKVCLREIADFCEQKTKEHRQSPVAGEGK